jgi:nitrogen fixation/metabolism regulation signal transduction histidine kinase
VARLPAPRRREADLVSLLRRVAALEQRAAITLELPSHLYAMIDPTPPMPAPRRGAILVRAEDTIAVQILDEGSGLAAVEDLFVPFFTTKPQGCGIGLFVARLMAEAHGGSITLANRTDRQGLYRRLVTAEGLG